MISKGRDASFYSKAIYLRHEHAVHVLAAAAPLLESHQLPTHAARGGDRYSHRLNMELDLQSLFELLCTAVLIG